ncbi:MAG: Maf family nucleotide pyrophosphatase [Bacteroidales bacterium]
MIPFPGNYRLVLVSRSPRRQQLLREAGLKFDVVERDFDESYPASLQAHEIAEYVAHAKALQLINNLHEDNIVFITSDTIVWCNGEVLGKPTDYESAFRILKAISGTTHEVITGICLANKSLYHVFSETTRVTFDILPDDFIDYYIKNHNPFDKAGAYGIQEWIGLVGNVSIEGSYFNVVGMPVNRLLRELNLFLKK